MSYPKKTLPLKLMSGSRQPLAQDHLAFDEIVVTPPPPDWLNIDGSHEWLRLAPQLVQHRVLNSGSLHSFAMYCALHATLVDHFRSGRTPSASIISQWRSLANDFGLTAMSQQKIAPARAPGHDANPFEELKEWGA
jgi:phage terminase small subunit